MKLSLLSIFFLIIVWIITAGCFSSRRLNLCPQTGGSENVFLQNLLEKDSGRFDTILKNREAFRVQIIYTSINRKRNNRPVFSHYSFYCNQHQYFYPASTVKLPAAVLALEKLTKLRPYGIDKKTAMITETSFPGQSPVYNDPTSRDGKPTIDHYIRKVFLASDNDAFNRLYEFLGQQYLNELLRKKGFRSAQILHRLSVDMSDSQNRHTNPVKFVNDSGNVLIEQNGQLSALKYPEQKILIGNGFMQEGKLIPTPFDFSAKNQISLFDLHSILQAILFPGSVKKKQRFKMSEEDRYDLMKYMSQYPSETMSPEYDSSVRNAGGKFILYGAGKETIPEHIRIFNKVGGAYGFLTDVAYVVDFEKKIEFLVSATIYCNGDGILNDDQYDYETVGLPFMKHLGEAIYRYESTRSRKHDPDLKQFKMKYEK